MAPRGHIWTHFGTPFWPHIPWEGHLQGAAVSYWPWGGQKGSQKGSQNGPPRPAPGGAPRAISGPPEAKSQQNQVLIWRDPRYDPLSPGPQRPYWHMGPRGHIWPPRAGGPSRTNSFGPQMARTAKMAKMAILGPQGPNTPNMPFWVIFDPKWPFWGPNGQIPRFGPFHPKSPQITRIRPPAAPYRPSMLYSACI
jgi:hypothetical protein